MASHLASEAWSNAEMAFSYANDVIIVTQTALVWAGCKESQFYSQPFGQAVASMYQPTSHFN